MELPELAQKLREMYDAAHPDEQALSVHLFGIKYAAELSRFSAAAVARHAGLGKGYASEINKGRNLARYVTLNQQVGETPPMSMSMSTPNISPEQVQAMAQLVGIPIADADLPEVANRFGSLMQELAQLQDLDLDGIEPVAIFPDPEAPAA